VSEVLAVAQVLDRGIWCALGHARCEGPDAWAKQPERLHRDGESTDITEHLVLPQVDAIELQRSNRMSSSDCS